MFDFEYTHNDSITEFVLYCGDERVLVAVKPKYDTMVKDSESGEKITFEQAERLGNGRSYEVLGREKTGNFVLVPGIIEKTDCSQNSNGNYVSKIKRFITESEKKELEKIIRDAGYSEEIKYWDPLDFF